MWAGDLYLYYWPLILPTDVCIQRMVGGIEPHLQRFIFFALSFLFILLILSLKAHADIQIISFSIFSNNNGISVNGLLSSEYNEIPMFFFSFISSKAFSFAISSFFLKSKYIPSCPFLYLDQSEHFIISLFRLLFFILLLDFMKWHKIHTSKQ